MEGFLHFKIPMWLRRVITRGVALIPVIAIAVLYGGNEHHLDALITGTQVFLSVVLPFSMAPLLYFTSSKKIMGQFVNKKSVTVIGWLCFIVLTVINIWLVLEQMGQWFG
ncbi:Mn2+ or Fe2+ transporter [Fructobacillus cardui]|nr:Mn2+ or Fe2+ transporter [Fructobacillus cardui]